MFCPICRAEFREGFERCSSCHVNLVKDLDNITEEVDGEFLLCRSCELAFYDGSEFCNKCGLKLIRAVAGENEYVFLEKPEDVYRDEDGLDGEMPDFEHLIALDENKGVILLESEDIGMLVQVQKILNAEKIDFGFKLPPKKDQPLGTLLGAGNPMEQEFPKIFVKPEDENRALELIANDEQLGLAQLPDELMDDDDEED
jgi:hypothetical protein